MSFSVQAGDADELLVLLDDTQNVANLHVLQNDTLSVTSVTNNGILIAGSSLLCRAPPATTAHYATQDVLNATVDEHEHVTIDIVNHSRGRLERIQGKVTQSHVQHARRWTMKLLNVAYKDSKFGRRIKLIINPFSGTGKASILWKDKLAPLFETAGCKVDVDYTEHIGHAADIARDLDLDTYDALVCLSGDGLIFEALRLPIGIIPGGSGNALATCVLGPSGSASTYRNALAVIKGRAIPMDVLSVTQGQRRFYAFLSQAYGLMADLDVGTDHLRWMGASRFVMEYLNGAMAQRKYACELSMRVVSGNKADILASARKRTDTNPGDDDDADEDTDAPFPPDADLSMPPLRFGTINDPIDSGGVGTSWVTLTEPISSIYAGSLPYMAPNLLQFPAAKADGLVDVTVQQVTGRIAMLSAVDGSEKGKHLAKDGFQYYKVEAYRLTPKGVVGDPKRAKWLAIDGEVMPYTPFQVEAHKGLARVLSLHKDWFLPPEWTS